MMKNSRFGKLIAVVLSLAVVLTAGAVIMAVADDATESKRVESPEFGIVSLNAEYAEQTELVFALRVSGNAPKGKTYLLFNKNAPEADATGEELFRSAAARSTAVAVISPEKFFEGREGYDAQIAKDIADGARYYIFHSEGIRASEIGVSQYVTPVVVGTEKVDNNDVVVYTVGYTAYNAEAAEGEQYVYTARNVSVANYAAQKIIEGVKNPENADSAREELYLSILEFGRTAAAKRWGAENLNDHFKIELDKSYCLVLNAAIGKDGEGVNNFIFAGESGDMMLRAEAKTADGNYFLHWADIYGNVIAHNRILTSVPKDNGSGLTSYIAVYGDRSSSPYSTTPDFESLATGQIISKDKTSYAVGSFTIQGNVSSDKTFGFNGWIVEGESGDKSLVVQRSGKPVGHSSGHTLVSGVDGANVAELDFKVAEFENSEAGRIILTGNNFVFGFITNVSKNSDGTLTFSSQAWNSKADGNEKNTNVDADGNLSSDVVKVIFDEKTGILTLKARIDTSGDVPVAYVYVNDTLIMTAKGSLTTDTATNTKCGLFRSISEDYTAGCDNTVKKIQIFTNQNNINKYEYDNIVIRNEFENEFN